MVRKLKKKDIPEVMEIWLEQNIKAHSFIKKDYWIKMASEVEKEIRNAEVYIYEKEDHIRGFIGLKNNRIEGLFVDKKWEFKGIGKKLMKKAKSKRKKLRAYVYKKNKDAIHFYLGEGFSCIKVQQDVDTGEEEYLMKWKGKD